MSIVSSTHVVGHDQPGGWNYVVETHTDSTGKQHVIEYIAVAGTDYVSVRTARAVALAQSLADLEAASILEDGGG